MADDWKPGDKALCISNGSWNDANLLLFLLLPPTGGPKRGDITTVRCVHPSPFVDTRDLFMAFREYPADLHYQSSYFRKLPPSSEEHINRLKESLPTKEKING